MPASVIDRSAIDCLSKPACGTTGAESNAERDTPLFARFARKTGRRLTSDPIRTSLGLLPSGPDPVGEWLVHRQSPGPYLGPKAPESKRDGCRHTPGKRYPVRRGFSPLWQPVRNTGSSAFADDGALI